MLEEKSVCESFKFVISCQCQIGCRYAVTNVIYGGISQAWSGCLTKLSGGKHSGGSLDSSLVGTGTGSGSFLNFLFG